MKPLPLHTVVSDTSFIAPTARLTDPVESPAEVEAGQNKDKKSDTKDKKKRKSHKDGKDKDSKVDRKRVDSPSSDRRATGRQEYVKPPVCAQVTSGPEDVQQTVTRNALVQTSSSVATD